MTTKKQTVEEVNLVVNDSTFDAALSESELYPIEEERPAFLVEMETATSLVPVVDQDIDIHVKQQQFHTGRLRRIMKTSYTGAEKISVDDLDQRQGIRYMMVQGCYVQTVNERVTNERTGEVKDFFVQALFKLADGRVVSAGGKMAVAFAEELIKDLGEFDWMEPLKIVVRQHKGKNFEYPNFQVIE